MEITKYPGEIKISNTINGYDSHVDYDQQNGQFTRQDWINSLMEHPSDGGNGLTEKEAEEICNILDFTSENFFVAE